MKKKELEDFKRIVEYVRQIGLDTTKLELGGYSYLDNVYEADYIDYEKRVFHKISTNDILYDSEGAKVRCLINDLADLCENGRYDSYLLSTSKRFYPIVLKLFYADFKAGLITADVYWSIFIDIWVTTTYIKTCSKKLLVESLKINPNKLKDKELLLDNIGLLNKGRIKIYRGENDFNGNYKNKGFSWTTSKEVAIWFANRYSGGVVYSTEIDSSMVLAYINDREEDEVIFNYSEHKKKIEIRVEAIQTELEKVG